MRAAISLCMILLFGCQAGMAGDGEDACEGPLGKPITGSELSGLTACCQAAVFRPS